MRRVRNSSALGGLLAAASWILVVLLVLALLRAITKCGWLCLD